jgi:O-antigen/teichoic acid export membrane protein
MIRLMSFGQRFLAGSLIRRNTAMTFVRQLLAAAAQLLLVVMIARTLGPEGNGLYALAVLVPTMMSTFLNLGVGPATVYYVGRSEAGARQALIENRRLALWIGGIATLVAVPVILVFGPSFFPGVPVYLMLIALVAFPVTLLLSFWNTILQGLEDFRAYNWSVLAPPYITVVLAAIAIYVLNFGVAGAVCAYVIGQGVGLALVSYFIYRIAKIRASDDSPSWLPGYKKRVLHYGWKAHLSNIMAFVNYRADIFLVNFMLTPVATGLYVIAVQMAERLWLPSQAMSTVLLPRLSAMHQDPVARYRLTLRSAFLVGGLTLGASLAMAAILWVLLEPVFGEAYADSFTPFLWLLPGIVLGASSRVLANCIAAAGKPEWNLYSSILVVTLNVTGNIVLIPIHGLVGAALATTVAYGTNFCVKGMMIRLLR